MTLNMLLARMLVDDEGWEQSIRETYPPETDPWRDVAEEWFDPPAVLAQSMLSTPEGKVLAAVVEAAVAWREASDWRSLLVAVDAYLALEGS